MTPEPGIYPGVRFEDYLAWNCMSQSALKQGRTSMLHLKHAREEKVIPTDDMNLGSALHAAFLEPETVIDRVVKWEGKQRRGKEWDAFSAEHAGKIILTPGMYEAFQGMIRSLRRHPYVKSRMRCIDEMEVSVVGEIGGVRFKGRADALTPDAVIDLKKTRDADPRRFRNQSWDLGYHIQGAIYRELFNRERVVLIAVESSAPYDVVPFEMDEDALRAGMDEAERLIEKYQSCVESGDWPGRSDSPLKLKAPEWAVEPEPVRI